MGNTNLVGTTVPSEADLKQLNTDIASIVTRLKVWGVLVEPSDRGSFLKPRNGAEKFMPLIYDLAKERSLSIEGLPLDGMKADLQVGKAAADIEGALEQCRQLASDTRLVAYGEAWQSFLGYYGVLVSMSSRDATLANRLRPVIDFMATGPRAKRPTP